MTRACLTDVQHNVHCLSIISASVQGSSDKHVALQSKVMEMQKNGDLQRRWDTFTSQELSLSIVSSIQNSQLIDLHLAHSMAGSQWHACSIAVYTYFIGKGIYVGDMLELAVL